MAQFFNALVNDTSFWAMLSTVLCFAFIAYKAKIPFLASLDNRTQAIRLRLEEAEKLRADAQAILDEYKHKSERAIHEAEDILRNAERRAEHLRTETEAKLAAMITRQELLAKNRISRLHEEAMQSVKTTIMNEVALKIKAESLENAVIPPHIDRSMGEIAKILQK